MRRFMTKGLKVILRFSSKGRPSGDARPLTPAVPKVDSFAGSTPAAGSKTNQKDMDATKKFDLKKDGDRQESMFDVMALELQKFIRETGFEVPEDEGLREVAKEKLFDAYKATFEPWLLDDLCDAVIDSWEG